MIATAAFGRLCVETTGKRTGMKRYYPAAFGRLCVETRGTVSCKVTTTVQPPSGGCVLKQVQGGVISSSTSQPPSGGCVLKPAVPPG